MAGAAIGPTRSGARGGSVCSPTATANLPACDVRSCRFPPPDQSSVSDPIQPAANGLKSHEWVRCLPSKVVRGPGNSQLCVRPAALPHPAMSGPRWVHGHGPFQLPWLSSGPGEKGRWLKAAVRGRSAMAWWWDWVSGSNRRRLMIHGPLCRQAPLRASLLRHHRRHTSFQGEVLGRRPRHPPAEASMLSRPDRSGHTTAPMSGPRTFQLIKGGGACMSQEKLVGRRAERFVVVWSQASWWSA